nr:E7 protein [Human papillomavirus 228]
MIGREPTIADIELVLEELVLPNNLLSNEESLDDQVEEEQHEFYRIDTRCPTCGTGVRCCVSATSVGIRQLEILLINEGISFCCPGCSRRRSFQHGRP